MPFSALGHIGFAKQSAKGTAAAPAYFAVLSADRSSNTATDQRVPTGLRRSLSQARRVSQEYHPAFTAYASVNVLAPALLYTMGGNDAVSGSGPYTHTFSLAAGDLPYLTIERNFQFAGFSTRFADAKIEQIELTGRAGQLVTFNLDARARTEFTATAGTATFDADPVASYADMTVTLKRGSTTLTGKAQSFSMRFSNQLQPIPQPGTIAVYDWLPRVRQVIWQATITVETGDDMYKSVFNLPASLTDPAATILTGTAQVVLTTGSDSVDVKSTNVTWYVARQILSPDASVLLVELEAAALETTSNDELSVVVTSSRSTAY